MQLEVNSKQIETAELQAASTEDLHLLDLLVVFAERKKIILRITVATVVVAAIAAFVIPSSYTAEAIVLPPGQNSSMSSSLLSQTGGLAAAAGAGLSSSLGIKNPADMYVSLFKSRTVEDSVIQRFELVARYHAKRQSAARDKFEEHAKIALGAKDGLITIRVTDRDPKLAAAMANGYIEEYRKFSANLAVTEASQRRVFFQQQLLEANENLAASEDALKHTEQSTGLLEVNSQARSLIESAAQLRAQIVTKEVQLQGMRAYATEDNPELKVGTQQLAVLQNQLAKLSGTSKNSGDDIIVPKGNIPEAGMQYLRKLRDVKYYETVSEIMAKQFELAKLDEARQGTSIQVVDAAVPPDTRSFPKRTLTIFAAIPLGFLGACIWCVLAEVVHRVKKNPDGSKRLDTLRAALK